MTDTAYTDAGEMLVTLTADIVAAHVSNNSVAVGDLATLIANVHGALAGLSGDKPAVQAKQEPAVSVRSSVKPDYIVCLEDGKKLKMLKRHLMTAYSMTPDEYRTKWGLPKDYPMVAPSYAAQRKELALKIGLGRKAAPAPAAAPKRKPKAKAAPAAAE
ncbi:MAG TPA: MucR family transcriptional regulator [Sphingobium sp.]|uniref:MucR family transcriptional regulator n=1 Tax=Sphingobium sp. TaxID=1912891 RepID=UPI002ED358DA